MTVLIAGGGIAGLALGLSLQQIGIPFRIFERVSALKPLGVGINLQPNAVRELYDLGLEDALAAIGVKTRDYGFYTCKGLEIWTEPRGQWAGYHWPQYAIHRGQLQMLLAQTLLARAGPDCLVNDAEAVGFECHADGASLYLKNRAGQTWAEQGQVLIAADGIHSAIRQKMYPAEGQPIWGGAVMWRGTTQAQPFLTAASMILMGHAKQRFVAYPISNPDPETGAATLNWIAELRYDASDPWQKEDWNRQADDSAFLPAFENWRFGWLDVPALVRGADAIYEYPMVDRDPLPGWTQGAVTLMGDAAHPTYPVGSNGASQAVIDGRILAAKMHVHGVGPTALQAFEAEVRPATEKVTLANRGQGPDAIMQIVEDRCGGDFEHIEDVISAAELAVHADKYKAIAGFGIAALNARAPLIPRAAYVEDASTPPLIK